MSTKPLDELYFTWLYSQVGSVDEPNQSRSYWRLLKRLYIKEFVWIVPNDDNRAEDGRDLRYRFFDDSKVRVAGMASDWFDLGCSMLELLLGLSRRLSFEDDGEPREWFWRLIENLDLERFNDNTEFSDRKVDAVLDRVIWRLYKHNGSGGLFPLRRATEDQRDVELWHQLMAYLLEQN